MEAEKFHNLLTTSYKPRRDSGIIQSHSEGLWARGGWWCESKLKRRRKRGDSFYLLSPSISSSEIGKKGSNFSFLCLLFHLDPQLIEWCLPTPMCGLPPQGRPSISLSHPFKCSSHPETPSHIQPEIIFNLDAPWPVKVACKISRHSG